MADLSSNFAGIKSPNPFWLASSLATNSAHKIIKAFKAGWGGAVWKTIGNGPPTQNVSPRYGSISHGEQKMIGFYNIELISDRPLKTNLSEIKAVKKQFSDRALVVSIMGGTNKSSWKVLIDKVEKTGADGIELNLSCPHGMPEKGMGTAIGQIPEYVEKITHLCRRSTSLPIIVKLTPNVTDIRLLAKAAKKGGADGISLINTINSIIGVDLDTMVPIPSINGLSTHGGYSGPAIKPIALHMVSQIATDRELIHFPISGIGGISSWKDAAEFISLGASNVQVCTAVMHYGFRIIESLIEGLNNWMDKKNYKSLENFIGKAACNLTKWEKLDKSYRVKAKIDEKLCIHCGLCYTVCEDISHQAISMTNNNTYKIIENKCVGCSLCSHVCPVPNCISYNAII